MKKIFLLALTAILAIVAPGRLYAELSTAITWDEPGSVIIKVGGTTASPVDLAPGATQHTVTVDQTYGYAYVFPANDYLIIKGEVVKANGSTATITPSSYGGPKYLSIDLSQYNGATVHVVADKVEYDGEIEINIINGRDNVDFTFPGTGRELNLKTGVNKVPFSTLYESNLCITALANGAEDYYVKKNDVMLDWINKAGVLKIDGGNDGVAIANGDKIEVKYSNTPDVTTTATVTISYADDMARQALAFIFNVTKFKDIPERDEFTVYTGDKVRLVFYTKDYDVWINDEQIESSDDPTTAYVFTAETDIVLNIRAAERSYGTALVTLHVANPDGIVLRVGALDGPVADLGEPIGTVEHKFLSLSTPQTVELTTYQVEVGLKSPKVYVFEAQGYWLQATEMSNGDPMGVATVNEPLFVLNPQVRKDTRLVVFLGLNTANVKAEDVKLRDRNQTYPLAEGYNEIMIDPDYSGAFSVSVYSAGKQPDLSAYLNMTAVKTDDNDQLSTPVASESVMHIWAGRTAPAKIKLSAQISADAAGASVVADKVRSVADGQEISVFRTCEISVTPAGASYLLNGEAPVFDGPTHTFAAATDYVVTIGNLSQVDAIEYETDVEADVYNVHGQLVRRAGGQSPLAPGIYVAAGRKFIVK